MQSTVCDTLSGELRDLERRSLENPLSPQWDMPTWRTDAFGFGYQAASGVIVTRDTALNYAAVWRAINIISASVAKTPLRVYRRQEGETPTKARQHPAYRLLRRKPNAYMTCYTAKQVSMGHVLLLGNAYWYIERDAAGQPAGLLVLTPDTTWPIRVNGRLLYVAQIETSSGAREFIRLAADDVIHLKGLGYDGLVGYSVIAKGKDSLGLGMAAGQYASRFYSNNATPSAVIEVPNAMPEPAQREFLRQWNAMHQGIDNSHRAAIITNGGKLNPLSFSASDAQILETRRFEIREVALWFGLPPHLLGDDSRTSYNSLEQENQSYLDHTLDPWFTMTEEECDDKLLTEVEKEDGSYYCGFDRAEVVRVDSQTLTSTLVEQVNNGLRNPDEARAKMNLPGYPNGEGQKFRQPSNIGYVGQAPAGNAAMPPEPPPTETPPADDDEEDDPADDDFQDPPAGDDSTGGGQPAGRDLRLIGSQVELLTKTFSRAFKRLSIAIDKGARDAAGFGGILDAVGQEHRDQLAEIVGAPLRSVWASAGRQEDPTPGCVQALMDCVRSEGLAVADEFRDAAFPPAVQRLAERWQAVYPGELAAAIVHAAHGADPLEIRYSPDQLRGPDGRWISGGMSAREKKQLWRDAHDARAQKAQQASAKATASGKASDHAQAAAAQAKAAEAATQAGRHAQAKAHAEKAAGHSEQAGQKQEEAKTSAAKQKAAGEKQASTKPAGKASGTGKTQSRQEKAYGKAAAIAEKASEEARAKNDTLSHRAAMNAHRAAADLASEGSKSTAAHETAIATHTAGLKAAAERETHGAAEKAMADFDRNYQPPPIPRSSGKGTDVDALHADLHQHDRDLERVRVGVEATGKALAAAKERDNAIMDRQRELHAKWETLIKAGLADSPEYRANLRASQELTKQREASFQNIVDLSDATRSASDRLLATSGPRASVHFDDLAPGTAAPNYRGDGGKNDYQPLGASARAKIAEAQQWLGDKIHADAVLGTHHVVVCEFGPNTPRQDVRAFQENRDEHADGRSRIALVPQGSVRTAIHEYGHAIESQNARVHEHMLAFLRDRCGHETPVNMRQKFGGFYHASETGRRDDFGKVFDKNDFSGTQAYYVGKDYGGRATEILSVGLEQMHRDAAHFAASDPQYFKLVMGTMHGHFATRSTRGKP